MRIYDKLLPGTTGPTTEEREDWGPRPGGKRAMKLYKVIIHRAHPVGHRQAGPPVLPKVPTDWAADSALFAVVRMIMPRRRLFLSNKEINAYTLSQSSGSGPDHKPCISRGRRRGRGSSRPPGARRERDRSGSPSSCQFLQ